MTAGTYTISISDANNGTQSGCLATAAIVVSQPTALVASSSAGFITCFGGTTTVTVSATGGTTPYTGTGVFSNISAGNYSYTVTDANGCQSTTTGSASQRDQIVVTSFTPTSGGTGTSITITGSGFTGATQVLFGGVSSTFTVNSNTQITAQVPASAVTGVITVNAGSCTGSSTATFTPSIQVNVKIFLEGYYAGNGEMRSPLQTLGITQNPNICDTLRLFLYSPTSLGAPSFSYTGLLNKNGTIQASFSGSALGNSYYIVAVHKNHLQTWSSGPVSMSNSTSYDFTTTDNFGVPKGYAGQLADLFDGSFGMFAGDITDGANLGVQDGYIDASDYSEIENLMAIGLSGTYEYGDLDGDGYVDSNDYSIIENQMTFGLTIFRPF